MSHVCLYCCVHSHVSVQSCCLTFASAAYRGCRSWCRRTRLPRRSAHRNRPGQLISSRGAGAAATNGRKKPSGKFRLFSPPLKGIWWQGWNQKPAKAVCLIYFSILHREFCMSYVLHLVYIFDAQKVLLRKSGQVCSSSTFHIKSELSVRIKCYCVTEYLLKIMLLI